MNETLDLKKLIAKTGLKYVFLADKLGIVKSTFSNLVSGYLKGNIRGKRHLRVDLTTMLIEHCERQGIDYSDCYKSLSEVKTKEPEKIPA